MVMLVEMLVMEAEKIMVEVMLVAEVEITVEVVVFITMSLNWQHAVSIVLHPLSHSVLQALMLVALFR